MKRWMSSGTKQKQKRPQNNIYVKKENEATEFTERFSVFSQKLVAVAKKKILLICKVFSVFSVVSFLIIRIFK